VGFGVARRGTKKCLFTRKKTLEESERRLLWKRIFFFIGVRGDSLVSIGPRVSEITRVVVGIFVVAKRFTVLDAEGYLEKKTEGGGSRWGEESSHVSGAKRKKTHEPESTGGEKKKDHLFPGRTKRSQGGDRKKDRVWQECSNHGGPRRRKQGFQSIPPGQSIGRQEKEEELAFLKER